MSLPLELSLEKAEVSVTPAGKPSSASAHAPICPQHPRLAARTCRQCSAFYCAHCLPEDSRPVLCLPCNTPLAVQEAPEKLRSLFRELWISPLVMGFGVFVGTIALLFGMSGGHPAAFILGAIPAGIASLPFVVVSFLVARSRSIAAAWIGFGFELMLLALLFQFLLIEMTVVAPSLALLERLLSLLLPFLMVLGATIVPMMTIVQIYKVRELRALLRVHQQARGAYPKNVLAPTHVNSGRAAQPT